MDASSGIYNYQLVKALFSWPPEKRGDLGFIEGDVIECLDVKENGWCLGRLKRNKAIGLFPSNFVCKIENVNCNSTSIGKSPIHESKSHPNFRKIQKTYQMNEVIKFSELPGPNGFIISNYMDDRNEVHFSGKPPVPVPAPPPHRVILNTKKSISSAIQRSFSELSLDRESNPSSYATSLSAGSVGRAGGFYRRNMVDRITRQTDPSYKFERHNCNYAQIPQTSSVISDTTSNKLKSNTILQDGQVCENQSQGFHSSDVRHISQHKKIKNMFKKLLSSKPSLKNIKVESISNYLDAQSSHAIVDWIDAKRKLNRSNSRTSMDRLKKNEKFDLLGKTNVHSLSALRQTSFCSKGVNGRSFSINEGFNLSNFDFTRIDRTSSHEKLTFSSDINIFARLLCRQCETNIEKLRAIFMCLATNIKYKSNSIEFPGNTMEIFACREMDAEAIANIFQVLCDSIEIPCDIVEGFIKDPLTVLHLPESRKESHFWNVVAIEDEFRFVDIALALPTHPMHDTSLFDIDDSLFLIKPTEFIYSHFPLDPLQQFLVQPLQKEVIKGLPAATSEFFLSKVSMDCFSTSDCFLDNLECAQFDLSVRDNIELICYTECVYGINETENSYWKLRGLAQPLWDKEIRKFRCKGVIPPGHNSGIFVICAGKQEQMVQYDDDNLRPIMRIPIIHTGENEEFEFVMRQQNPCDESFDLYIRQPQSYCLHLNNTYIFSIRQHIRGSDISGSKVAKLALKSPNGKIYKLSHAPFVTDRFSGQIWELALKVNEVGQWKGLILGEKMGRWADISEWKCI